MIEARSTLLSNLNAMFPRNVFFFLLFESVNGMIIYKYRGEKLHWNF